MADDRLLAANFPTEGLGNMFQFFTEATEAFVGNREELRSAL